MAKQQVKSQVKSRTKAAKSVSVPPPPPVAPVVDPPVRELVYAACKRGTDQLTVNQSCNSRQAYKISKSGTGHVTLECAKCQHTWSINTGGAFNHF